MKIRQPGEPSDDGYYKQDREIVLRVLKDHKVTVTRIHHRLDSYLLEKMMNLPAKFFLRWFLQKWFSVLPIHFLSRRTNFTGTTIG